MLYQTQTKVTCIKHKFIANQGQSQTKLHKIKLDSIAAQNQSTRGF
jgi:hypothetical protein